MKLRLVMMGVAGCGKSSLAAAVAHDHALPVIEGDDFHSESSRDKMRAGIAMTDADRQGWLDLLAQQMALCPQGVVLTCSALKRAYRERLRAAAPGLRFVFLDIPREEARARVAARAGTHFFSLSLVDSQFATLESPAGEAGVLRVDAREPLPALRRQVADWLHSSPVNA
jgi:gluconokinase